MFLEVLRFIRGYFESCIFQSDFFPTNRAALQDTFKQTPPISWTAMRIVILMHKGEQNLKNIVTSLTVRQIVLTFMMQKWKCECSIELGHLVAFRSRARFLSSK